MSEKTGYRSGSQNSGSSRCKKRLKSCRKWLKMQKLKESNFKSSKSAVEDTWTSKKLNLRSTKYSGPRRSI